MLKNLSSPRDKRFYWKNLFVTPDGSVLWSVKENPEHYELRLSESQVYSVAVSAKSAALPSASSPGLEPTTGVAAPVQLPTAGETSPCGRVLLPSLAPGLGQVMAASDDLTLQVCSGAALVGAAVSGSGVCQVSSQDDDKSTTEKGFQSLSADTEIYVRPGNKSTQVSMKWVEGRPQTSRDRQQLKS
ncbi:unnamed protein product [Pleuronectes platessa]|uniref:Uncharacterized protein n=1 Tax=Pleuronectes platessa TaxID=8262 RepID=A0A9N7YXF4_PLEPL|nr:unnamed protein product [Pleuronectes platessa]